MTIELQKRLEAKCSREIRVFNKIRNEAARRALWEDQREHLVAHLSTASERSDMLATELTLCRNELVLARVSAELAIQNVDDMPTDKASPDTARLETARIN